LRETEPVPVERRPGGEPVAKLRVSVALGDYDRTRPLLDGRAKIDGVDPIFMTLEPEEIFFRALRHAEFDVCELSLSSTAVTVAQGRSPYVGVPAFLSRAFRHTSIYIRTDKRIREPRDLVGRRVGVPEYQLTACVWARAMLEDDFGVKPTDIRWVRGGLEQPGRPEKIDLELPAELQLESAAEGRSLSMLLEQGEIDAVIAPRAPSCFDRGHPHVDWLFADPAAAATDYYRRTSIFPIMHLVGIRRTLAQDHPWLAVAVLKALDRSKAMALAQLGDTSATKVTMPFVEEQLRAIRRLMGPDFWPYGLAANRSVLDAFLDHHHRQGLSSRRLRVEELFHPATHDVSRI
jgi:4,5-dihydroxyphthalate decarboxylase